MDFAGIQSPSSAFVAGLVTSLHCAGMCGPLACWLNPTRPGEDATTTYTVYQSSRLFSYSAVGALAGTIGAAPLAWLEGSWVRFLPWALVVFFLAVALRLDRRLRKPLFATRWSFKVQTWSRNKPRWVAAAALGTATPLLPCGPLYFVIALAALSGSAVRGIEFMLAFGLGTLPLLWLVQSQFGWARRKLSPVWISRIQVSVAVIAALVISWRLRGTLGFNGPTSSQWVCF